MARHRAFSQVASTDPITFDLSGSYQTKNPEWPGPATDENQHDIPEMITVDWEETFHCLPTAPGAVIDDLAGTLAVDPTTGGRIYKMGSTVQFLRDVIVDEDLGRFEALFRDRKRVIGLHTLVDVVMWLNEEYSARPT